MWVYDDQKAQANGETYHSVPRLDYKFIPQYIAYIHHPEPNPNLSKRTEKINW